MRAKIFRVGMLLSGMALSMTEEEFHKYKKSLDEINAVMVSISDEVDEMVKKLEEEDG